MTLEDKRSAIVRLFDLGGHAGALDLHPSGAGTLDLCECTVTIEFSHLEELARIVGTKRINICGIAAEPGYSDVTPGSTGAAFIEWEEPDDVPSGGCS